ncbi:MAG: hypothetical protein M1814_006448 [Vezdaea aestivalis]|nr:MAG: hypothetical protein M1814_006448 [Vezdaea aestivalis]
MQPESSKLSQNDSPGSKLVNPQPLRNHGLPAPPDRDGFLLQPQQSILQCELPDSGSAKRVGRDQGHVESAATSQALTSASLDVSQGLEEAPSNVKARLGFVTVINTPTLVPGLRENKVTAGPIARLPNEILTHVISHLPPQTFLEVSLVSKRFHNLVNCPHAWRLAFARYFPGSTSLSRLDNRSLSKKPVTSNLYGDAAYQDQRELKSDKRQFSRLTALASWRSEYTLRTRLLNSIVRANPGEERTGKKHAGTSNFYAVNTYRSGLDCIGTHVDTNFQDPRSSQSPRVFHGPDDRGLFVSSNPTSGRLGFIGSPHLDLQDPNDVMPTVTQWGLGRGETIVIPNPMDVSHVYGAIHVEGFPEGNLIFHSRDRSGYRLPTWTAASDPHLGIPKLPKEKQTICSVWIARSKNIMSMSNGMIGLFVGDSLGVLTCYSLGAAGLGGNGRDVGEMTARWALSPGVPIVAIKADDSFNPERLERNRVWAVAVNALGECFYLTKVPQDLSTSKRARLGPEAEKLSWATGRTVSWNLIQQSSRKIKSNIDDTNPSEGLYSPRSSSDDQGLKADQFVAETKDIEEFMKHKPIHFRNKYENWNMKRTVKVDFAGNAGTFGESIIVVEPLVDGGLIQSPIRFTRCGIGHIRQNSATLSANKLSPGTPSILGGTLLPPSESSPSSSSSLESPQSVILDATFSDLDEEWRESHLRLGTSKVFDITAVAIDNSVCALNCSWEDPLLSTTDLESSFDDRSPRNSERRLGHLPGQRGRYLAVGTDTGIIVIWNVRAPTSSHVELVHEVQPIRIIHTRSPKIACLALTALFLVHGGNDSLVQAWDPLASRIGPLRTIHRQLKLSPVVPTRVFNTPPNGAGAICLAPDPTDLRGVVSVGMHMRYWHYSSEPEHESTGRKRRPRRGSRLSNSSASSPFVTSGRSAIEAFIEDERLDHEYEETRKKREAEKLAGRFGVGLLGLEESEEEVLAYARLLSEETFQQESELRQSGSDNAFTHDEASTSNTYTDDTFSRHSSLDSPLQRISDSDLDEHNRSDVGDLASSSVSRPDFLVKYKKASRKGRTHQEEQRGSSAQAIEDLDGDIEFAIQLSLAEEQSRIEQEPEGFSGDKGKGRAA